MSKWYAASLPGRRDQGKTAPARASVDETSRPVGEGQRGTDYEPPKGIGIIGFAFLIFEWLIFSRAHELLLPIPKLILSLGVALLVATTLKARAPWRPPRLWRLVLIFGIAIAASVPFSYWPGGSLKQLYLWTPYCVLFIVGCRVVSNPRMMLLALDVLGIAYLTIVAEVLAFGTMKTGRLTLVNGTFADSNDLATLLIVGSTFGMYGLSQGRWRPIRFVFFTAALLITPVLVLRTGSRGGLITMVALAIIAFLRSSGRRRLVTAIALPAVLVASIALLPDSLSVRFQTLFEGIGEGRQTVSVEESRARGSTEQRLEMLLQSIRITMIHPLVGVGAGQFSTALAHDYETSGEHPPWLQTHNAYTQVSSELGVIAFFVYIYILLSCALITRRFVKWGKESDNRCSAVDVGACVGMAVYAYIVGSVFTSIAYHLYMPLLAMLCVGIQRWCDDDTQQCVPEPPSSDLNVHSSAKSFGGLRQPVICRHMREKAVDNVPQRHRVRL
jgi:O-antigen ligase